MADRVYRGVVRVALGVFRAVDLRLDVDGHEHVPRDGGAVVVVNHTGYLDFALAGVPFWQAHRRLIRFMAKNEVFAHRVGGPLMRAMQHIPVDRAAGSQAFRDAVAALRRGELVGVFPEATISRSFGLKAFKPGAVRMARAARVPIIPVTVWGSQRVWTKGRALDVRAARRTPIAISVGEPLDPRAPGEPEEQLLAAMQSLLRRTQARYPEAPSGAWWLPADLGGGAPTLAEADALDAADAARRLAARDR